MGTGWYIINTYAGQEAKIKERLEAFSASKNIFRIFVPPAEKIMVQNKNEELVERKVYPGYILVEMELNQETYNVVRKTPGVTGFVGGLKPIKFTEEEVKEILSYPLQNIDNLP
ncbi:transcription termination/antitermination NusG family protein [Carboxydothermus ferrireducens]|uniref:Transcriptional antiterminator NusG n=1 Tax=Carboxydothermus ferrireducens DSM 11255 TaxID=1119529 RepID=A0ABX2R7G2_9THEO|nr:transcription termination/antitermination NusG family protein [Carboxydothermus ferrireducens]NYE57109.1 transcriptional antiterminator NusG [Carboxydothermus ferrireducens DSM 11255]